MTEFLKADIDENGKIIVKERRDIKQSDIRRCPHTIFAADHYRPDGTCKCNDPNEKIMAEWGYVWNGSQWASPDDDE